MIPASQGVTQLLMDWNNGDQSALDQLLPLVNDELRRLARRYMRRESPGHTLQTSALVNEAYLRLMDQRNVHWQNRAHFFGIAAQLMRRILIDHARKAQYAKRGGGALKVSLDEAAAVTEARAAELLAVKVLDFGLAKITRPAEQPVASDISTLPKTASGASLSHAVYIAKIYVVLNEKELVFSWLERGLAAGTIGAYHKDDPVYDTIRGNARYGDLPRRMGFPQ